MKKGAAAGSITTTPTAVSLAAYPHGGAFHPYTKPLDGAPTNLQPRLSAPLRRLTSYINDSYRICNPGFRYMSSLNPRRVLTKPAQGVHNQNYDNANFDLILYVNDILGLQTKNRYVVLDLLGQGTFGQVVKCRKQDTGEIVAVKVVKNRPAYFNQGMFEVHILEVLNSRYNGDQHNIVQMVDSFMDRGHLCLVFELLSVNLFELIAQNQYKGLSTNLIRIFLRQILKALVVLEECGIIHCDLKPENILLRNTTTPHIKLIDFGSACYGHQTVYTYIQSRFYRSPEVLIGHPYTTSIDMWSLGCMAAELFLGIPLFPGHNEYNQLARIVEMQGDIPQHLLERGKFTPKFYNAIPIDSARFHFQMKSKEQWSEENNTKPRPTKRYFPADKRLGEIIQAYPCKKGITPQALDQEKRARVAFVDFIEGLLQIDPNERWTAEQASQHPFVTGQPFTGPWTPPPRKPVTPLIAPPPFGPGVGPTARSPPAPASASASGPQLSSSLPPASLINPPPAAAAGQRRPGPLPMTTGGPPPMGLPGGTSGGVGPVYNLVAAEKNAALGRRGSLPVAHDLSAMMPSGVPLMAGGYPPPPLPHGFGGPPYPPPGMQLQGPPPGHPASAGGNPRGGSQQQQQRPRGQQQQQPQYPSPPSASSHIQRSPRSMPNMASTGAYGQQPLMQHGQRGGVPPGYADLVPSASVTLSTSPTTTATTSSLPSSPKSSSALAADPGVAYYYDSSTYPPPEHGNAAGRGKPTLGPFQKQLDARNQHRRRSVSMDPKRQGLPKQRTQTAAAISAAAGEISAGGGGVGGGSSGGKGKGSQRMAKGTQQGGGRGAFAAEEPKGRGGTKAQDAKGYMQRAGSADGGEETTKGGGSGRGSGRRQRSVSNMEPVERNGSHNGDTHSESPVGSPTSEMERLSLDGSSPESFTPSPSDTFNAALSSLTSTSSSSFSSSFALSSSAASATRSPKGPARQAHSSSSSSSSSSSPHSSSSSSSSASSSSSFSSTTSSATLGLSPDSNARKRSPRSPRKQLPSSKLGSGGGAGGHLNGPSSLPLSSMSTAGASSSLSARARPPTSPRNKQPQTPQKGKARERSPPRTRAIIPPHHQTHPSPNHSNQAAVQSEDDGWDSRATEDLMFDEGSPYASSPTGMKSPPGAELGGGAVSSGSNGERAGVDMRQSNPISIAGGGGGSYTGGRGFYAAQPSDASWSEWSTLQAPKFSLESSYGAKPPFPSAVGAGSSFSDSASSAIFGFSPSSMPSQGFFYSQPFPPHQQQGQPSFQPSTSNPSGMDPRYLGGPPPIVGTPLMGMVHSSFEVGTPGAGRGGPDDWASSSPRHPHHYQQHQHQHQHQQAYSSPYSARHPPQHHPHHPPSSTSSSSSSSSAPPPVGGIRPPPAPSAGED